MAHDAKKVAQYLLWLGRDAAMTPMRVLKLVYISHGWMLALHDRPLIFEAPEAWKYGPVIPSVYQAYKKFGGSAITEIPACEPSGFTEEERKLLCGVWEKYRRYSGLQLSSLTHQPNSPWAITRQFSGAGARISDDLIKDHYRTLAAQ